MLWRSAAVFCLIIGPARAATPSLNGDADCDGIIASADLEHLQIELTDGDDADVANVDGGTLVSCSGADVNEDGRVTAADLPAVIALLSGGGTGPSVSGPVITFLGTAAADGRVGSPVAGAAIPIFRHAGRFGFRLIVEAERGSSGALLGQNLFNSDENDPNARPDLQVILSRSLADGSEAVCDESIGGVPGFSPPSFAPEQSITDALNDLSCRFSAITNQAVACTVDQFGIHAFVSSRTRTQFCLSVSTFEAFAEGPTIVTAQVRDAEGRVGVAKQIIVQIGNETFPTFTPTATRTRTEPVTPPSVTATSIRSATQTRTPIPNTPSRTPSATRSATGTITGSVTRTSTVTRTPTRTDTVTLGPSPTPTRSATRSGTATRTPSGTRTPTRTVTPTRTHSGTPTRTETRTPTLRHSLTPTRSASPTRTGTRTRTSTRTGTPTTSATPTRTITGTRRSTPTPTGSATRSGTPTRTGSRTRTGTVTPTGSRSRTATRTETRTQTGTITRSPTRTPTPTRSGTRTRTGTVTPTGSRTRTLRPTASGTPTRSATRTRTATITRTVTRTGTATRTGTRTRTPTATLTPTRTRTPTITRTPSRTGTITRTPTITLTPTITGTPTITRTPTPTPRPGSEVSFFGLARPDYTLLDRDGTTGGLPFFRRSAGDRFVIVIEGKRGPNRRAVGLTTFDSSPSDPFIRPALEIIVSRALGNGSPAVCDDMPPIIGGVPASASFATTQAISNAINDFACRFVDGSGLYMGRGSGADSCIKWPDGLSRFANEEETDVQYCALIAEDFAFPVGDTTVTVRLNDADGRPGPPISFVIRVDP